MSDKERWIVIPLFSKYKISERGVVITRKDRVIVETFNYKDFGKHCTLISEGVPFTFSIKQLLSKSFNDAFISVPSAEKTVHNKNEENYGGNGEWEKFKAMMISVENPEQKTKRKTSNANLESF